MAGDWIKITGRVTGTGVDDGGRPFVTVEQEARNQHGDLSAVGSGTVHDGTPNIRILWDLGELNIEPGIYNCQLIVSISTLDHVFHGTFQIVDHIN